MESLHPEGDASFVDQGNNESLLDSARLDEDVPYVECPIDGCCEMLPVDVMDYHIELHADEDGTNLDGEVVQQQHHHGGPSGGSSSSSSGPSRLHREAERHQRRAESSQARAISAWKRLLPYGSSSSSSSQSSRHRKDAKATPPADSVRGKRLGVGVDHLRP